MNPATILVVDDEPDLEQLVLQRFRRQVKNGELKFHFAGDGEEALSMLDAQPDVDLVLSDINMPRMDGLTLLTSLKEVDRHLRTVIVSAYGDMQNIRTAMNRGAFDFITKPIEFEDLEATIEKTLNDLHTFREMQNLRDAAERAKNTLSRYFSPNLAKELSENSSFMALGGEWREVSFVFTDLTDFTPLIESLEPNVVVPLLNEYLSGMTQIAFRHGGTIDKIVGDAVHAIFGAPLDQPGHAENAIACALSMDAFAESYREEKAAEGVALGATRIGVHSGCAIVGNFGGELLFDYTAHGDAINTAARLENLNKYLGTRICVSMDVVERVPEFKGRPVGWVRLKGKSQKLKVFEPLNAQRADDPESQAYRDAYRKLEDGDPTARQAFAALLANDRDDPLATFHLKRLLAGETSADIVLSSE
jgi:class 3 adenylate cyclase